MNLELSYKGKVQPQSRPRHRIVKSKDGRTFTQTYEEAKSRDFKAMLHLIAQKELEESGAEPFDGPVSLWLVVTKPIPKSFSKARLANVNKTEFPATKPDIDNIAKAVMDALSGVWYFDDRQVVYLLAYKKYGQVEGIDVRCNKAEVPLAE